METQIPELVSFSAQPVDWQGKLHQSFTLSLGFDLISGTLLAPDAVYASAMKALEDTAILDSGLPKKEAEWLLAGKACAPKDQKVTSLVVDIQLAGSSRRLLVEEKEAFTACALSWDKTWGCATENPNGLVPGNLTRAPVTDKDLPFGQPACPLPRAAWPCRMQKMGTYDKNWLSQRWPGVPDDFDWSFYNLSQPCQRLTDGITGHEPYLLTNLHPCERRIAGHLPQKTLKLLIERQGEWFACPVHADTVWFFPNQLAGMIIWHAMVSCQDESASDISTVRVEMTHEEAQTKTGEKKEEMPAQASEKEETPAEASEEKSATVPLAAPTVHAQGGPLPEPASAETAPELPKPAAKVPEPPQNHAAELSQALDENIADINQGLAEAGLPPLSPAQVAETKQKLKVMAQKLENLENEIAQAKEPELADVLHKAGLSQEQVQNVQKALALPMPDPTLVPTPELWQKAVDEYLGLFADLLHPSGSCLQSMRSLMQMQGPGGEALLQNAGLNSMPDPKSMLTKAGLAPEKAAKLLELLEGDIPQDPTKLQSFASKLEQAAGFPPGSVSQKIAAAQTALQGLGFELPKPAQAEPSPEPEAEPEAKPLEPQLKAPESQAVKAEETPEPLLPIHDRAGVIAWLALGRSLAGQKLTGLDLSHLDLSGCDLQGADLSQSRLCGSKLRGANLSGAKLCGADCTEADFSSANLQAADLSLATAQDALFYAANLTELEAKGLKANAADFSEARLDAANVNEASLENANFFKTSAKGLKAQDAICREAKFRFCDMHAAIFFQADLSGADVHQCVLTKADLRRATMVSASFCYGTDLSLSDLRGAELSDCVMQQVTAHAALFTGALALKGNFSDSTFTNADFRGAKLCESDFSRSQLNGCLCEGVNLFKGSLHEAKLSDCNFRNANLYGVDLARTDLSQTVLAGADITNTICAALKDAS